MTKRTASQSTAEPLQKRQRQSLQRSQSLSPSRAAHTYEARTSRRPTGLYRSRRLSNSPPLSSPPVHSAPARLQDSHTQLLSPDSGLPRCEPVDEDDYPLLYRILSGLEYARTQNARGADIMQTTRFLLKKRDHLHPGSALDVLRQAHKEGYATQIWISQSDGEASEVWEIGVPRPDWVTEGAMTGIHDPQWWYRKTAAQVKAGPHAEEADVGRAAAALRRLATRQANRGTRTKREIEIDMKLMEGLRRQRLGLKMDGDGIERNDDDDDSETSLPTPSVSNNSTVDSSNSDDDPLMESPQRVQAVSTSRARSTSRRRRSVSSSGSDAYRPPSSSASSIDDSNEANDKRPTVRRHRVNRVPMSQPESRRTRLETAQSSDSDDGLPIKRGIRQTATKKISNRGRPFVEAEESSSGQGDGTPVMRHVGRGSGGTPPRRRRPVVVETSESE